MSHVPHDLHEEFPADGDVLHELKISNAEFRGLAESYRDLNREIHRIETDIEPASDQVLAVLKKHRLAMLDELREVIGAARTAAVQA